MCFECECSHSAKLILREQNDNMLKHRSSKHSAFAKKTLFVVLIIVLILLIVVPLSFLNKKFSALTNNLAQQIELLSQEKEGQALTETRDGIISQNLATNGDQGNKGDTGNTGTAGSTGAKGDTGDKGNTGATGTAGSAAVTIISKTTTSYNGSLTSNGKVGYQAANDICNSSFSGSHFCRTDEVIQFIAQQDIAGFANDAWIAEGPPGYTSKSNDCSGWTTSDTDQLGAYWSYDSSGGGKGWLVSCETQMPLSCCQ